MSCVSKALNPKASWKPCFYPFSAALLGQKCQLFFLGSTVLCPCLRWSNKSQVCCVLRMHTEAKKSALSRPSWGFAKSNHVLQQEDGLYCIEYTRRRFSLLLNCRNKLRIPMPSSNSQSGVSTTRNILTIQDTNRHNRYAPAINHATNATRT